jgi:hypothetical protein
MIQEITIIGYSIIKPICSTTKTIFKKIRDFMLAHNHTIAVAESVTAGHLQAALSTADEASLFFRAVSPPIISTRNTPSCISIPCIVSPAIVYPER